MNHEKKIAQFDFGDWIFLFLLEVVSARHIGLPDMSGDSHARRRQFPRPAFRFYFDCLEHPFGDHFVLRGLELEAGF